MKQVMLDSREVVVDYMMPLGLHHIFAGNHHYGPEPWYDVPGARRDWMPPYYHRADKEGLGFDRTSRGSNAVAQYPDSLCRLYGDLATCPEKYLLWFHHVPWDYKMKSGRTFWDELCHKYDDGVKAARGFCDVWTRMKPYVDAERYDRIEEKFDIQAHDAVWWKDACLLYFQTFSKRKLPKDIEKTHFKLKDLRKVQLPISNYECPTKEMLPRYNAN